MYFGHKHVETGPNCSHELVTLLKYHILLHILLIHGLDNELAHRILMLDLKTLFLAFLFDELLDIWLMYRHEFCLHTSQNRFIRSFVK